MGCLHEKLHALIPISSSMELASSSSIEELRQVVVEQPEAAVEQINGIYATPEIQTIETVVPLDEGMVVHEGGRDEESQESDQPRHRVRRAAMSGRWREIKDVIKKNPQLISDSITEDDETALHIAAGSKNTAVVENLVNNEAVDVERTNKYGSTALFFAAASGAIKIAKLMVEKNKDLPYIRDMSQVTPLLTAVLYGNKEMASYLFSVTELEQLKFHEQLKLLIATIKNDFYDLSLEILKKNPKLATLKDAKNNHETALHVLARKLCKNQLNIWKKGINFCTMGVCCKDVMKTPANQLLLELLWEPVIKMPKRKRLKFISHPTKLLHDAASAVNVEFLTLLIRKYPNMILEEDSEGKSILHIAIENRLEDVFNAITHEIRGLQEFSLMYILIRKGKYNMLNLAAKLAAPNHLNRVSGAVLQMQREFLWFKEVEKITLPYQLMAKHENGLTPRELFTKEHKDLRKDGEEWMKTTANSCMLVATLITTIVFAAAFTVPGGNDNNTGTPIFQRKLCFSVFVISDAVALISSSTTILIFLSVLTSRYAEEDFANSLPSRLFFGFMMLFISIVCMVVAFSAAFFMLYQKANYQVPVMVATLAIVPVFCFSVLHFKLWFDIFHSTYLSRFIFKSSPHYKLFPMTTNFLGVFNDLKEMGFRYKREQKNE